MGTPGIRNPDCAPVFPKGELLLGLCLSLVVPDSHSSASPSPEYTCLMRGPLVRRRRKESPVGGKCRPAGEAASSGCPAPTIRAHYKQGTLGDSTQHLNVVKYL